MDEWGVVDESSIEGNLGTTSQSPVPQDEWGVIDEQPAPDYSYAQTAAPTSQVGLGQLAQQDQWGVVDEQPAPDYAPAKDYSILDDALLAGKAIGSGLYSAAADVFPKTVAEVYRGGNMPLRPTDRASKTINEQTADLKSRELPPDEANREVFGLIKAKDIQGGLSNLGYSAGSMAAGVGAGAVAGSLAAPGPGTVAGGAAGLAAALGAGGAAFATGYRSAGDQFVEDIRKRVLAADPNTTEEKWGEIKQAIAGDKQLHSLWEAGPEAIGEALTMGLIKTPAGKIIKEIPFIKNGAARLAAGAAAKAGIGVPVELLGETATQMGQTAVSAPYTGEKAQKFGEALKDVGPQTVVMTLATLGLGGLANRYTPSNTNAREATQAIYDLVGDNQHKLLNDTELSTAQQAAEYLLDKHPSIEARDSLQAIQAEREARGTQQAPETIAPEPAAESAVAPQGPVEAQNQNLPVQGNAPGAAVLPPVQPELTPAGIVGDVAPLQETAPGSSPVAQHIAQGGSVDLLSGKPAGYSPASVQQVEVPEQSAPTQPVAPEQLILEQPAAPAAVPVQAAPAQVVTAAPDEAVYQRPATEGDSPIFYSQMQRVLEKPGMLPKIATANSMLGAIKKHVGKFKGVELEESGLTDWLSGLGPKMVTRQDVLDEVAGRQIKLGEVGKTGIPVGNPQFLATQDLPNATKFGQYQVPGGENYKETLITLPKQDASERDKAARAVEEAQNRYEQDGSSANYSALVAARNAAKEVDANWVSNDYHSSHWDEPNVLAHLRTNERTDADGKKTLFVEEIQSDWHQEGKKKGYSQGDVRGEVFEQDPDLGLWGVRWPGGSFSGGYHTRAAAENASVRKSGGVPDAPFKNTSSWSLLAMKRTIRQAVEGGMDRVAWTPGEVQAERYDLSKQVGSVYYIKGGVGAGTLVAMPVGHTSDVPVFKRDNVAEEQISDYVGKDVAERLLSSPVNAQGFHYVEGDGLKVGGEGMKGFYDQILPKEVAKYIKQFGGKVGETAINADDKALFEVLRDSVEENLEGAEYDRAQESLSRMEAEINKDGIDKSIEMEKKYGDPEMAGIFEATLGNIRDNLADYDIPGQKVWSFDITPEMKKAAMEGQPLYKKGDSKEAPAGVDAALAKDVAAKLGVNTESMVIGPKLKIAPRELLAQMEMDKAMDTGGAYYRGKSYIFTDNHEDLGYTGRAILHEAFHEGVVKSVERMAKKLGLEPARDRVRSVMQTIYSTNAREVQRNSVNRKYGHDFSKVSERLQATEEWLAMNAETVKPKLMDKYIAAIRAFIRAVGKKLGIKGLELNWSEAETRNFIQGALKAQKGLTEVGDTKPLYQRGPVAAAETAGAKPNEVEEARRMWAEMGTDSPYFKEWFGDSKVVDENGKPLVVYHGTKSDFSEFKRNKSIRFDKGWFGDGFYLTGSVDLANGYARRESDGSLTRRPASVMPVFVSVKNPYRVDLSELSYDDSVKFTDKFGGNKGFEAWLKENGYDGVVGYRDPAIAGEGADFWEIVVFSPTQIKSATGNRGTFGGNNPDIRYARPTSKEEQLAQARERLAKALKGTVIRREDGIAADPAKLPLSKETTVAWLQRQYQDYVDQYAPVLREAGKLSPEAKAELQNKISFLRGGGGAVEVILTGKGEIFNYAAADPSRTVPGSKSLAAVLEPIKGDKQLVEAFDLILKGERQIALAKYRPEIARKDYLADRKYWLDALKEAQNADERKLIRGQLKAIKEAFARQVKGTDSAYWTARIPEVETTLGPEKTAKVRQVIKDFRAFLGHAVLDRLAEAGVLSREAYKAIKSAPEHEWYAPMQRQMDQIDQAQSQFVGHADVIKRLKGSLRNTLPAVESAIAYVDRSVRLVAQNNVAKAFLAVREANPDLAQVIREAQVDPARVSGDRYIRVIEDGKKKFYEAPKEFVQALNGITPQEATLFKQVMALPAKALRFGATMSLEFPMRNFMRDQWSAMINSNYGYIPFAGALNGMAKIAMKDNIVAEWKAAGGDQAYFTSLDRAVKHVQAKELLGMQERGLVKYVKNPGELVGAIADGLRSVSDFSEKGTRVGLYANARKKGATPGEAATESRMSTLDFGRMGLSGRAINSIIAFWNANVQDVDILARNLRDKPGRTLAKIALGVTLPSALLWVAQHDDERYKSTPQWLKDTFWVIYPWWDKEVRVPPILPKPFLMGALFGSSVEHMLDFAVDKKRDGLKDAVRGVAAVGVPGFMPTIASPILEWITNYSFFRGRSIESEVDRKLPPPMRANTQTQEIYKKLGNLIDVSPIKLENTVRGYTGNLGLAATAAVSAGMEAMDGKERPTEVAKRITEQPGIRAVFGREPIGSNSQQVVDFYDNLERSSQAEAGYKVLAGSTDKAAAKAYLTENKADIVTSDYLQKVSRELADIRKVVAATQKQPTMAPEMKRQRMDMLNRRMTEIAGRANALYEKKRAGE